MIVKAYAKGFRPVVWASVTVKYDLTMWMPEIICFKESLFDEGGAVPIAYAVAYYTSREKIQYSTYIVIMIVDF